MRPTGARGRASARLAPAVAGAALANYLPSVAILGQWSPLRSAANGWCRWRGAIAPQVALTFDDGPVPGQTNRVLALLAALNLRATFFCLGELVERHAGLVRDMLDAGHQVETHGYRHRSHFASTPSAVGADLRRSLDALRDAGGEPRWVRPPYGHVTSATIWHARAARLRLALWSGIGREWALRDGDAVGRRLERSLQPGAVLLLHDTETCNPSGSLERVLHALTLVAAALDDRGWKAVTLDEAMMAS